MANPQRLSANLRESIAAQIGERLPQDAALHPAALMAAEAAPLALGASLSVVMLPLDHLRRTRGAMARRVVRTGRWHHQICNGESATGFATSVAEYASASAPHQVVEVARSPLPEALQASMDWVDANVVEKARADVLTVPAYHLTGLWLHGRGIDAVVIASMPARLKGLALNTKIESPDFLHRLAENAPVRGVGTLDKLNRDGETQ